MSEPKRANLITVDSAKGEKKKVTKTIRLDIDLFHSNEKEYPAYNYKELVRFEEGKSNGVNKSENPTKNGPQGLDPFSDNDEDVERIAKQFEQKYGSASTYGKTKGRSKDDYADIGAGYDENDSFIDNTDGYDEMIPPEADTAYGGFYINCGALEFTSVPYQHDENEDPNPIRRNNKRAISSSTSGDESSESSGSESDTTEESEKPTDVDKKMSDVPNGIVQHKSSEERKKSKSEKRHEKKRHKRVRRDVDDQDPSHKDDPGKMDVDVDDVPVTDGGSADQEMSTDSRTSDSVLSKPTPSSDNAASSESSREAAVHSGSEEGVNTETALPVEVSACVESIRTLAAETRVRNHGVCTLLHMQPRLDHLIKQLDNLLRGCRVGVRRSAWGAAARTVGQGRARLQKQARLLRVEDTASTSAATSASTSMPMLSTAMPTSTTAAPTSSTRHVAPVSEVLLEDDTAPLQNAEVIMLRLKRIINTMRPSLIHNYNQECQRIHDANKKIAAQNAAMEDDRRIPERRLPKRTFPWNEEVRLLLSELVRSCGASWAGGAGGGAGSREEAAAVFLRDSILPLFPKGFVRMPTLLQQASLSKDQKIPNTDNAKRYKLEKIYPSTVPKPANLKSELENVTPHHLPITSTIAPDKPKNDKIETPFNSILSSLNLPATTNVTIEKTSKQPICKDDNTAITLDETNNKYTPPNSIGCITITPVNNTQRFDTKTTKVVNSVTITASPPKLPDFTEIKGIRVKSPSELMKPGNTASGKDDKSKHTLVTPTISMRDKDDLTSKRDKHHTSKHRSSHDKVKHGDRTKSPNSESLASKEIRKSVENSSVCKSDSTRKVDSPDFVKKKVSVPSKGVNESSIKLDNGVKSSKREQNEMMRPYTTEKLTQNETDNFVKPTDKKRPDLNSKSYKIRDDSIKILSDKDPLSSEIIMDVSDSSSDVELIEEFPPIQSQVNYTKPTSKKDENSLKTDVLKKNWEPIHRDLDEKSQRSEVSKKNSETIRKDLEGKSQRTEVLSQNPELMRRDLEGKLRKTEVFKKNSEHIRKDFEEKLQKTEVLKKNSESTRRDLEEKLQKTEVLKKNSELTRRDLEEKLQKTEVPKKNSELTRRDLEEKLQKTEDLKKNSELTRRDLEEKLQKTEVLKKNSELTRRDLEEKLQKTEVLKKNSEVICKDLEEKSRKNEVYKKNSEFIRRDSEEKSKKNEISKKIPDTIRKDSGTAREVTDVSVKQNAVPSRTVSVLKSSRKDTDGFTEPASKRSKSGNGVGGSHLERSDSDLLKSDSDRTEESSSGVSGSHVNEKVSENTKKEDDISDINHYDIKKVMQDLKELQKSQEVPETADVMFYSRADKKNHNTFSTPHFDMFHDSSSADNKSDPKSLENSNHSVTSG